MNDIRLLESKTLIPRILYLYVNRESLFQRMKEFSDGQKRVMVINAGAGFGKTMIMSFYAKEAGSGKSAWYDLDAMDNELFTFVEYLTYSIQHVVREFAFDVEQYSMDEQRSIAAMVHDFSRRLTEVAPERLFLFFDDFQEIESEDVITFLSEMINITGDRIKFLFATKARFPHFLLKYLYKGMVDVIDSQEMLFSKQEIEALVRQCPNVKEVMECTEILAEYTEGWPAGVMSVLLNMKQSRNVIGTNELRLICDECSAGDYLMYEVFRKLPYEIQMFLSQTSVLKVLSADICNDILEINNARNMLDYLVKENLFVVKIVGEGEFYRYHSLFKAYLLEQLTPIQYKNICRKAALSCMGRDVIVEAVEYAMESDDFELVQLALERIGFKMVEKNRTTSLFRWLEYLERHQTEWSVNTTLLASSIHLLEGNIRRGEELIRLAREKARIHADKQEHIRVLLAMVDYYRLIGELYKSVNALKEIQQHVSKQYSSLWYCIKNKCMEMAILTMREKEALELAEEIQDAPMVHLSAMQLKEVTHYRNCAAMLLEGRENTDSGYGYPQRLLWLENGQNDELATAMSDVHEMLVAEYIAWKRMWELYQKEMISRLQEEIDIYLHRSPEEHTVTMFVKYLQVCLEIRNGNYDIEEMQLKHIRGYCEANCLSLPELKKQDKEMLQMYEAKHMSDSQSRRLLVECFGEFQVKIENTDMVLQWRTKKAKELFAFLFHRQGEEVSKDVITEALWPEVDLGSVSTLFYTTVSYVRKTLSKFEFANVIQQKNRMYSMDMSQIVSTRERLELMSKKAAEGKWDGMEPVSHIYRGAYLESIQDEWVIGSREYYERVFMKLCRCQTEKLISDKKYNEAIEVLSEAVSIDGYAEDLVALLIKSYGLVGDIKSAKRQFERTQKLLRKELDVEPGESLVAIYRDVTRKK